MWLSFQVPICMNSEGSCAFCLVLFLLPSWNSPYLNRGLTVSLSGGSWKWCVSLGCGVFRTTSSKDCNSAWPSLDTGLFILICCCLVVLLCPTLCHSMDCSPWLQKNKTLQCSQLQKFTRQTAHPELWTPCGHHSYLLLSLSISLC